MGNRGIYIIVLFVLFAMLAFAGCTAEIEKPEGTLSVSDLLDHPVYDKEVVIYGKVDIIGKVLSPYFELGSGGKTIKVWYTMMIENDGTPRKPVKAEGISNGSWVIVTGELKKEGKYRALNDFWASKIEKLKE
jgi:hypothetical protein